MKSPRSCWPIEVATERLAVWLDSYRAGLRHALQQSADDGFHHVQANTVGTELNPRDLTHSARRHLRRHLDGLGLQLGTLAADYPGLGLADAARVEQRMDHLRNTLTLCADLQVRRISVSLGGFGDPRGATLSREVLAAVAETAGRYGIQASIHDAVDAPEVIAAEVRRLRCPHLRVTLDTLELPLRSEVVASAGDLVGHVYLRDVRRRGEGREEVDYGRGEVDFAELLAQLAAGAGDAALVIRRDRAVGIDALRAGREYMGSLIDPRGGR